MKIHVWAPEFATFGGGIGKFSRELAFALHQLGHELFLAGKLDHPVEWNGSRLWGVGNSPAIARNSAFATGVLAQCARQKPDKIISTHINFGPVAQFAHRSLGIPYKLVAHGIDVNEHLSPLKKSALRGAAQIIAVSSWTRLRLLDVGGIDPSRIAVLPNTVSGKEFTVKPESTVLRNRYALSPGEKVILTVARLGPTTSLAGYKGCDRILEALGSVKSEVGSVRYIIVGQGPDRARLEALAKEKNVADCVTFAGFVPDAELADHYRLADVYAMPSTGEGFGIVYLEAMACGTPAIAGNLDGSVDALDCGRLGLLVNPLDAHEIAAAIVRILRNEGPAWWFDRNALHDAVIERFGRDAFRANLKQIIATGH